MERYERSIKLAFDKLSGQILDADEVFETPKDSFEVRQQYHKKRLLLSCCECDQDLMISGSKYDRLHFKHKPGHTYCILADENVSPQEHEIFAEIFRSKESNRHKHLKNKIGSLLHEVDGVDKSSIIIDNKFIIRGDQKRRPDVYCRYYDKELVFEIQLSSLSLEYILSRYEFYKEHGIYLIWILDNFDIHNQGTLERDIKYLTKYENFFKLDESAETFHLECEFKVPFQTEQNKIHTKWQKKSIPLSQVKFDKESYQIYYFNFGDNKAQIEAQIKAKREKLVAEQRIQYAEAKAKDLAKEIRELRATKSLSFALVEKRISELDEKELEILNSVFGFVKRSPVFHWLSTATQADSTFLEFIFECNRIKFDINESSMKGKTAFQAIFENKKIRKYTLIRSLFRRGYELTEADEIFFSTLSLGEREGIDIAICAFCNKLTDKTLVDDVFRFSKQLFVIESAKKLDIVGFNYKPNEWIAFANNAIQNYAECWELIERAFKKFNLWEKLISIDKKGTFRKKVQDFYSTKPKQDQQFDKVFRDLYPEVDSFKESS